jgi:Fe-S oxidoreductase
MLQGEVIRDGWQDERVKKALDLCLSCKACKSECPANVDLATYRAEFLSHYYEHKHRPLHAYAFGKIDRWARMASPVARMVNAINGSAIFRPLINKILGLAAQRQIPRFAERSFRRWLQSRDSEKARLNAGLTSATDSKRTEVVLWIDTFNNYFHPETSRAAMEILEDAGFQVTTPQQHLCCGRPLYDFGMLDEAKKYLSRILQALDPQIEGGLPIVVLEPSCASVFRDELVNLFPDDARAKKLRAQTFLLSEFLEHQAPGYMPDQFLHKILVHGHCHHKALMKMTDQTSLLTKMGADVCQPDSGCCGMAGAFGFEKDKYKISQSIGERVLLPAIREEPAETVIVADGFSCREQIRQATGRKAVHFAEVLQMAMEQRKSS